MLSEDWLNQRAEKALADLRGDPCLSSRVAVDSYRAIWISDLHLGTPGCKAAALLDFLRRNQAETLYLVGDIVEGWNLGRSWHWNPIQHEVVEEIRAWVKRGVRVVFLPGNHDEFATSLVRTLFGPVLSHTELVHRTADGRRMLVLHGHQFNRSLNPARWLPMMGTRTCAMAIRVTEWYERSGDGQRGQLSSQFRDRFRKAINRMTDVDNRTVCEIARRHNADGVICGHTHQPEQRHIGSILYANDGDWVESCTALVEEYDGALRLIHWNSDRAHLAQSQPALEVAL